MNSGKFGSPNLRRWETEEDAFLKKHYPVMKTKELAERLSRSLRAIWTRARYLGLKKSSYIELYGGDIRKLTEVGFTIPEISEKLEIKYATVHWIIEQLEMEVVEARTYVNEDALNLGVEIPRPLSEDESQITFSDYYRHWYNVYRKEGLADATRYSYRNVFSLTIKGGLGGKKLQEITRSDVQAYLSWYGQDRSKQTVLDHMQYIRSCFKDAAIDGYIKQNPAGNVKLVYKEQNLSVTEQKKLREQKKWLEIDEYQKLRYYLVFELQRILRAEPVFNARGGQNLQSSYQIFKTIIFLGLKTGARVSELVGITKGDISFESSTINIDKTWDYKSREGGRFMKTKNLSSIREILIDEETLKVLQSYIEWLNENEVETAEDALFIVKDGRFHNSSINNLLRRILRELEIEPITMHKLRHTHASYLIAKGVPLQVVAKRLGHTDTQMIQRVYGHLLQETEDTGNKMILNLI